MPSTPDICRRRAPSLLPCRSGYGRRSACPDWPHLAAPPGRRGRLRPRQRLQHGRGGLRLCSWAVAVAVSCEMVAGSDGLGQLALTAAYARQEPLAWLAVLAMGRPHPKRHAAARVGTDTGAYLPGSWGRARLRHPAWTLDGPIPGGANAESISAHLSRKTSPRRAARNSRGSSITRS